MAADSPPAPAPPGSEAFATRGVVVTGLAVGIVLLCGAWLAWRYEEGHPSTEDAYLKANYVWVAPQVAGEVVEVGVARNQKVRAGEVLFRIDPRPYEERLARAKARRTITELRNEADRASVASSRDVVREREAKVADARAHYEQLTPLIEKGFLPELRGVDLTSGLFAAEARLQDAQEALDQISLDAGNAVVQTSRAREASAEVTLAAIELGWTEVVAPFDGWTTENLDLRVGAVVEPGEKLFPLIEAGSWWVQANFKETVLDGMRPGQSARVTVDMYGNHEITARVESISPTSAAAFSLLPPENTTGNWVKVTQRIPVRITLPPSDPERPYRLGASCQVRVDLGSAGPEMK